MKTRIVPRLGLLTRSIGIFLMLCGGLALMTPGGVVAGGNNIGNGPGCVAGGKGYVGPIYGPETNEIVAQLNWHGTFIFSHCAGATGPQDGDSDIQQITYPDGATESYKIVYSTQDLTSANGPFCYWDLTIDPGQDGPGYHCPEGSEGAHLYEWIVSSSGDSPYLEPANSGGWKSNPNGRGVYS